MGSSARDGGRPYRPRERVALLGCERHEARMHPPYRDRRDAGRQLASLLLGWAKARPLVLAIPRGGVPVAYEVARALRAPLDILVVRKIGVPGEEELAMGAVASGATVVRNADVISELDIPEGAFDELAAEQAREVARRESVLRGPRPRLDVSRRTLLVVDDGLATGSTMRVAVRSLRSQSPGPIVVAVPIGSPQACRELAFEADEVVCARRPEGLRAVGQAYEDFGQTTDAEVRELLDRARGERQPDPNAATPPT